MKDFYHATQCSGFLGFALTLFTVSCWGWQDEGDHIPDVDELDSPLPVDEGASIRYEYGFRLYGEYESFRSTTPMLPQGDVTDDHKVVVIIDVIDKFHTKTRVEIEVQVRMRCENESE